MNDARGTDRDEELKRLLARGLTFLIIFVVVIAVVTFLAVKALHLNSNNNSSGSSTSYAPPTALPTAAPHHKGGGGGGSTVGGTPSASHKHKHKRHALPTTGAKGLHLAASPTTAGAMQKVTLSGSYTGHNGADLNVQRWENGAWADFPVSASVSHGTFQTWVESSQPGANRFRVWDGTDSKGSNVVSVTIQ